MTTALGVFTADLVWMTASVIGLTAVLVAFEPAFLAVRLIGSAYLSCSG
jgi:threonine/homoserine/homoserine lactone efflux protein